MDPDVVQNHPLISTTVMAVCMALWVATIWIGYLIIKAAVRRGVERAMSQHNGRTLELMEAQLQALNRLAPVRSKTAGE